MLKAFKVPWATRNAFVRACLQVSFAGLEKQLFYKGCIAKTRFSQKFNVSLFLGLLMIVGGLGFNFHDFCCPGDWLTI